MTAGIGEASEGAGGAGAAAGAAARVGASLEAPVDEAPLAFVDLEMTGLDAQRDRVCEVCVIRCRGRVVIEAIDTLVDPCTEPGESAAVHGLRAEQLAGAPTFEAIAGEVERLLEGAFVVAHAARYDVAFLEAELGRAGRVLRPAGVIDTLELSRRAFSLPSHRLGALAEALGLPLARAHRAGDDARATMALFWRAIEVLAPSNLGDLCEVRVGERHARPEIVARARQAAAEGAPVRVRYRPARRGPIEETLVITAVVDVDPPRVLGYGLPGRGRKQLRADRILAILPVDARPPR